MEGPLPPPPADPFAPPAGPDGAAGEEPKVCIRNKPCLTSDSWLPFASPVAVILCEDSCFLKASVQYEKLAHQTVAEVGMSSPSSMRSPSALQEPEPEPDFALSGKLAAETNRVNGVVLLHVEPPEAAVPTQRWRLYQVSRELGTCPAGIWRGVIELGRPGSGFVFDWVSGMDC